MSQQKGATPAIGADRTRPKAINRVREILAHKPRCWQIDDRTSDASILRSSHARMSAASQSDAFTSVKMGTLREYQLYMVW